MMLSSAVESRIIRSNPLAGVKLTRKGPSRARQALTVGQVEALANAAGDYRVLVLVLAYGGLRPNEAFALRRRHRDDFGQLVVEEGLVEVRGRLVTTDGKTHSARVVPLPRSVADEFAVHLDRRPQDAEAFVFVTSTGCPIGLRNFRRRLDSAATAAAMPEWFTPYMLRHTCASLMASQGVPITTAAAIMGHDPAMFLRTYAHLYPGDMRGAAAVLDKARAAVLDGSRGAGVVQTLRSEDCSRSATS
ncbi:MAG: site-specific integrase [Actinomycetota bacterium]|nr:site-specific integrase [Actinomycetota bacterium]